MIGRAVIEPTWGAAELDALRELYSPLRRFAAVIGRWDVDPDDLVQDAYARVLRADPSRIDDLGRYLRRTIANLATDQRRADARAAAVHRVTVVAETTDDAYPSDLADLMQVEPRVRALLFLVDVEGSPISDAADAVGMSSASARMALMRARRRLRAELNAEYSSE